MATTANLATDKAELNIVSDQKEYNLWFNTAKAGISQYDLAQQMKVYYYNNNPISGYRMVYSDLLGWALACVDWMEIADTFIEAAKEQEEHYAKACGVPEKTL